MKGVVNMAMALLGAMTLNMTRAQIAQARRQALGAGLPHNRAARRKLQKQQRAQRG